MCEYPHQCPKLNAPSQIMHPQTQCLRNSRQRFKSDFMLRPFNVPNIVPRQIRLFRQFLLGQPGLQAVTPEVLAQNTTMLAGVWHFSSQTRTARGNHSIYTVSCLPSHGTLVCTGSTRRTAVRVEASPLGATCPERVNAHEFLDAISEALRHGAFGR